MCSSMFIRWQYIESCYICVYVENAVQLFPCHTGRRYRAARQRGGKNQSRGGTKKLWNQKAETVRIAQEIPDERERTE